MAELPGGKQLSLILLGYLFLTTSADSPVIGIIVESMFGLSNYEEKGDGAE